MKHSARILLIALIALLAIFSTHTPAVACTRAVYVAKDGTVLIGRSMDGGEGMFSNMWVLPRGMKRDGMGGKTYGGDAADKFVEAKLFNSASLETKFEEPKK